MKKLAKITAAAIIALGAGIAAANADSCSGHSHDEATAGGAVGGGLIGGLASHSVAGGVVGAVAGGFIGNSIARSEDCRHHYRRQHDSYYRDEYGHRHYYR